VRKRVCDRRGTTGLSAPPTHHSTTLNHRSRQLSAASPKLDDARRKKENAHTHTLTGYKPGQSANGRMQLVSESEYTPALTAVVGEG
jgi:hypothetical protein